MTSEGQTEEFQRDGVTCLRGVFSDRVDVTARSIDQNMADPGPHASENAAVAGRFLDGCRNWTRIPELKGVVRENTAAEVAARGMRPDKTRFFHEHVLVKKSGTPMPTPWHKDRPCDFFEGVQTVSFRIPVDPVDGACLRPLAGLQEWECPVRPVSRAARSDFYSAAGDRTEVPDPDAGGDCTFEPREWSMAPGVEVLFGFRCVHGARGNPQGTRRRTKTGFRQSGQRGRAWSGG